MVHVVQNYSLGDRRMAGMFADRKTLFVDTLDWDVPVTDGRYEIDGFDGAHATYLIATDEDGEHVGSMRLLPTTRPHILGELFSDLCDHGVPVGEGIFEITRLCLPCRLGAPRRLEIRHRLISAMVDHAFASGITALTGVVAWSFLEQVLVMGWECEPLGQPRQRDGTWLGAFRIDLDASTIAELTATRIYSPGTITAPLACLA